MKFDHIQIGAYKGNLFRRRAQNNPNGMYLLIEPVPYLFEELKTRYENLPNAHFENIAISDTNHCKDLFFIGKKFLWNKPAHADQLASFSEGHIKKHRSVFEKTNPAEIQKIKTHCKRFIEIVEQYKITSIGQLTIDTEGEDHKILKDFPFDKVKPKEIVFEYKHMKKEELSGVEELLAKEGYSVSRVDGENYIAKKFEPGELAADKGRYKLALVTTSDKDYFKLAIQMFESYRNVFDADVSMCILPYKGQDEGRCLTREQKKIIEKMAYIPVEPDVWTFNAVEVSAQPEFQKLSILTKSFFRKYDIVFFVDADSVIIADPYEFLLKGINEREAVVFPLISKDRTLYGEFNVKMMEEDGVYDKFKARYENCMGTSTACFAIYPKKLQSVVSMKKEIQRTVENSSRYSKHRDQGIFQLLFHGKAIFAKEIRAATAHFGKRMKNADSPFHKYWMSAEKLEAKLLESVGKG